MRTQENLRVSITVPNQLANFLLRKDSIVTRAGLDGITVWVVAISRGLTFQPSLMRERPMSQLFSATMPRSKDGSELLSHSSSGVSLGIWEGEDLRWAFTVGREGRTE